MATVTALSGEIQIRLAVRVQARKVEALMATREFARTQDAIRQIREAVRIPETSLLQAHQAVLDSLASIQPANFVLPRRTSGLDPWRIGLSEPKSVDGLDVLLAGYRNALRAMLDPGIGRILVLLTLTRDQHGKTPGQIVTSHPQVTRGPNVRRSILRSSADLVVGA